MTSPYNRKRLVNTPMIIAIGVVVALAIAVVIVLITRDGSNDDPTADGTTTSAAPTYAKDPDFAESDGHGLAFDYPEKAGDFDPDQWTEPADQDIQDVAIEGFVRYPACEAATGGSDMSMAILSTDADSLPAAAVEAMDTVSGLTLTAGSDYEIDPYSESDATSYTTGGGLKGSLLTASLTADDGEDSCGTDTYNLTTLAVASPEGTNVALIVVYRANGETVMPADDLGEYTKKIVATLREEGSSQ